jgi:hypothetical protein
MPAYTTVQTTVYRLEVVPAKEQVEILVIDHVERPSAN